MLELQLDRGGYKERHGSTRAIRIRQSDGDASFSSTQARTVLMNYNDYYARQAGGALPYFQRGHGLGSLFGSLLRSAMPLIKRSAVALGKGALKTGVRIAGDVLSGQNIKTAAKRRVTDAVMSSIRAPPGKRIKRAAAKATFTAVKRRRKKRTSTKRTADIFDDKDGVRA